MRARVLVVPVALAACACSTAARPSAPAPVVAEDASSAVVVRDAAPPEEPALAWGTRPPATGPLYPVIEGDCTRAEVWPLDDGSALFSYGALGEATTTLVRFTEEGVEDAAQTKETAAFREFWPLEIHGSWPEPLVAHSVDRPGTRARSYETIWAHRADVGWVSVISHRDADKPEVSGGAIFRGNAIVQRHPGLKFGAAGYFHEGRFAAVPIAKDAAKLAGLETLRRADMDDSSAAAGETEIFALGRVTLPPDPNSFQSLNYAQILNVWRDGKVREVRLPPGTADRTILQTKPSLVVVSRKRDVRRLVDGDTWEPVAFDVAPTDEVLSLTNAPDGSTWMTVNPGRRVFRRDASGQTNEVTPPSAAQTVPPVRFGGWPRSEARLVGVERGDPWALSETGTLAHWTLGKWEVVPTGPIHAEAIALPAKGDLYVVGGYAEKLPGWTKPSVHYAVLRTKRPKEVLRCNEGTPNGRGFMSFPPRATAECKTPFVVLLRTAYSTSSKPKADFANVREALNGEATELLEIASGEQRYLGFVPASVEAGNRAIEAVAKKTKATADFRPEIVCGVPANVVRTVKTP